MSKRCSMTKVKQEVGPQNNQSFALQKQARRGLAIRGTHGRLPGSRKRAQPQYGRREDVNKFSSALLVRASWETVKKPCQAMAAYRAGSRTD